MKVADYGEDPKVSGGVRSPEQVPCGEGSHKAWGQALPHGTLARYLI